MPYKFRTPGPWGPGALDDLDPIDIDNNFWQAIQDIKAKAAQGVGIDNIIVSGSLLTVVLTDHTLLGPYQLPVVKFTFAGEWLPNHAYLGGSIITQGGSTYFIPVNHTSDVIFDPGANDGHGQNFYELLLQSAIQRLGDLQDVHVGSPTQGGALIYSSGVWIAGPEVINKLADLLDVRHSPSPSTGDVVYWDGFAFSYIAQASLAVPTAGLNDLTDVTLFIPANDQTLVYDLASTQWKNKPKQPFQTVTATKGLVLADASNLLSCASTSPITIVIPLHSSVAFPENTQIWVRQSGTGPVTVDGSSVILSVPPGRVAAARAIGSVFSLRTISASTDSWQIDGDLAFAPVALSAAGGDLLSVLTGNDTDVLTLTPTANVTFTLSSSAPAGKRMTIVVTTSGATSYNIVFSSGFKPQSVLATGTVSGAVLTVSFVSDGTFMNEVSRSTSGSNSVGIPFTIDGGGSVLTTGTKGSVQVPFNATITAVTMLADQSGSVVVDIWKCPYASYNPPTTPSAANKITASAPPTISSGVKSTDATLTGWTTAIAAGDILAFNVNSVSTIQRVTVELMVMKS